MHSESSLKMKALVYFRWRFCEHILSKKVADAVQLHTARRTDSPPENRKSNQWKTWTVRSEENSYPFLFWICRTWTWSWNIAHDSNLGCCDGTSEPRFSKLSSWNRNQFKTKVSCMPNATLKQISELNSKMGDPQQAIEWQKSQNQWCLTSCYYFYP